MFVFLIFSSFAAEIQEIFKGPIFAQLMSSVIIICVTCFMLVNQIDNLVQFGSTVAYLITMVTQILLFCWIGNELIYSVSNSIFIVEQYQFLIYYIFYFKVSWTLTTSIFFKFSSIRQTNSKCNVMFYAKVC